MSRKLVSCFALLVLVCYAGHYNGRCASSRQSLIGVTLGDPGSGGSADPLRITTPCHVATTIGCLLPTAMEGVDYKQRLEASGGRPPYTWTKVAGTLPQGLTLTNDGAIQGKPTTTGKSDFTVRVTDTASIHADKQLSLVVNPSLSARRATPPSAGKATPPIAGKAMPPSAGKATPPSAGKATPPSAGKAAAPPALAITTASLPSATVGTEYQLDLRASGGTPPRSWRLVNGKLPDGLSLDETKGTVSGTPKTVGTYDFTVKVTDGAKSTVEKGLSIAVGKSDLLQVTKPGTREGTPLKITTTSLPGTTVGRVYSQKLEASGGTLPYAWTFVEVKGEALPPGLNLMARDGSISGTPTTDGHGPFIFTVRVTDAARVTVQKTFSIAVGKSDLPPKAPAPGAKEGAALKITTAALPGTAAGKDYSQKLEASGGKLPYAWTFVEVKGEALPPGLNFSPRAATIFGTLTTAGDYRFTVRVTDGAGSTVQKTFGIVVTAVKKMGKP